MCILMKINVFGFKLLYENNHFSGCFCLQGLQSKQPFLGLFFIVRVAIRTIIFCVILFLTASLVIKTTAMNGSTIALNSTN